MQIKPSDKGRRALTYARSLLVMAKSLNNELMREVGSRPYFFLISSLTVLSGLLLIWGLFYKIQPTATGFGLIAKMGKIERVIAPSGGLIKTILVKNGSKVSEGQILAQIDLEGYDIDVRTSKAIAELSQSTSPQELEQKRISTQQQIEAIQGSLLVLKQQISANEKLINEISPLVESGDVSMSEYLNQIKELDDLKLQAYTFEGRIATLKAEEQAEIDRISSQYRNNLRDKESSEYQRKLASDISSPITGVVSSIDASVGTIIEKGASVAQISYEDGAQKGIFLAAADDARKMRKGDQCLISPAESPPEKYGYVRGIVDKVGEVPANPASLGRVIGLDYTVNSLFEYAQNQTQRNVYDAFPFVVVVDIPLTKGKPEWTTGTVPPWGFTPGGPAEVQCVYDTFRPISFLVPWLREQAGYRQINSGG